jgi:hypothetical protein
MLSVHDKSPANTLQSRAIQYHKSPVVGYPSITIATSQAAATSGIWLARFGDWRNKDASHSSGFRGLIY